jgi:Tfp pilus assembly protein PilE
MLEYIAVILVIGLMAGIAVPSFGTNYEEHTFDQLAKKALAEVTEAQKRHYEIYKSFIPCDEKSCASKLTEVNYVPFGVRLTVVADDEGFKATAFHSNGTGEAFVLSGSANS